MDSDTHNQQQENMSSGLTRYRSAPSSYFSNLINSGVYRDEDLDPFFKVSSPETDRVMSRFMSTGDEFMLPMKHEHQHMFYTNNNTHHQSQEVVDGLTPTILVRQSSSPAGFLEHNNVDNGYPVMRSMGFSSASRLLSRIPEQDGKTAFTGGSWDESTMLTDEFLNEFEESQQKLNDGGRMNQSTHVSTGLTHQLSLPTSSTELSVKEKLLQFQDNVPLRSRAKRGCATHPRSIAERVRRTRISERMRKLQDLVPNMDKQTSTADMLDLAVEYIKELQNQVETLSEHQRKCTCPHKLKS